MSNIIPSEEYVLIIVTKAENVERLQQCDFIPTYGINLNEVIIMDADNPYCEIQLDSANLNDIAQDIARQNIDADIQVLPTLNQQKYGVCIQFNAYVRQGDGLGEVHINSKSDENIAYEFTQLVKDLEAKGITQASEMIQSKILELHPHGWV